MKTRQQREVPVGGNRIFKGFEAILAPFEDKDGLSAQDFVDLKLSNRASLFEETETITLTRIGEMHDLSMMMHRINKEGRNGPREVYEFLKHTVIPARNEMLGNEEVEYFSTVTFLSPLLREYKKNESAVIALNENKGPLTDAASCKRCGEPKVHRRIAQTRSADEGFSSIFICPKCSFSWVEN